MYYLNNVEEGGETAFLIADNTTTTPDVSNSTFRILKYAAYTLWVAYSTRISTTDHDHRQRNSSRKRKENEKRKNRSFQFDNLFLNEQSNLMVFHRTQIQRQVRDTDSFFPPRSLS